MNGNGDRDDVEVVTAGPSSIDIPGSPPASPLPAGDKLATQIACLRAEGAQQFDPARFHYLDALSRRSAEHHGSARRFLDAKLAHALDEFTLRFKAAQGAAAEMLAVAVAKHGHAMVELKRCFDAGDFAGLRLAIEALDDARSGTSLAGLVRRLEQQAGYDVPQAPQAGSRSGATTVTPEKGRTATTGIAGAANPAHAPAHASASMAANPAADPAQNSTTAFAQRAGKSGALGELKTLRNFRNTWAKLSADKQVAQALVQAPKNAGPVNSHMLALRSLALMREVSPDYLNRFMSYADTLICLDATDKEKPVQPKKTKASKAAPKK